MAKGGESPLGNPGEPIPAGVIGELVGLGFEPGFGISIDVGEVEEEYIMYQLRDSRPGSPISSNSPDMGHSLPGQS